MEFEQRGGTFCENFCRMKIVLNFQHSPIFQNSQLVKKYIYFLKKSVNCKCSGNCFINFKFSNLFFNANWYIFENLFDFRDMLHIFRQFSVFLAPSKQTTEIVLNSIFRIKKFYYCLNDCHFLKRLYRNQKMYWNESKNKNLKKKLNPVEKVGQLVSFSFKLSFNKLQCG